MYKSLLLVACMMMWAAPVWAEDSANVVLDLVAIAPPAKDADVSPEEASERRRLRRHKITKMVASRLRTRLKAAGVKHAEVDAGRAGALKVRVFGAHTARWVRGVIMGPGRVELRAVEDRSRQLQELAQAGLPSGLVFGRGSIWGMDRAVLEAWAERVALVGVDLVVAPRERGGWRVVALGAPLGSGTDLIRVRSDRSSRGETFASMRLSDAALGRWSAAKTPMAFVLDAEVITTFGAPRRGQPSQLELRCPTSQARMGSGPCVRQIVGRMAAAIPISLMLESEIKAATGGTR